MQTSVPHDFSEYARSLAKAGYALAAVGGVVVAILSAVNHRSGWTIGFGAFVAFGCTVIFLGKVVADRRRRPSKDIDPSFEDRARR